MHFLNFKLEITCFKYRIHFPQSCTQAENYNHKLSLMMHNMEFNMKLKMMNIKAIGR